MHPLKESTGATSPIEAEAIDLLRAAPGHEPPIGQKQRVRTRLLQQRVTHRAVVFRPAVVVSVVLCAAAASAAMGRHWIAETVQSLVSPSVRRPAGKATTSSSARRARAAGVNATANGTSDGTPPTVATVATVATVDNPSGRRSFATGTTGSEAATTRKAFANARIRETLRSSAPLITGGQHSSARPPVTDPAPSAPIAAVAPPADLARGKTPRGARPAEDTGLVFDAMRALRQEGQPARASSLLDEYMRRHPGGALAEEALALSVEAAMARRDPRARVLIADYMTRYPTGHFRAAVESARGRLAP